MSALSEAKQTQFVTFNTFLATRDHIRTSVSRETCLPICSSVVNERYSSQLQLYHNKSKRIRRKVTTLKFIRQLFKAIYSICRIGLHLLETVLSSILRCQEKQIFPTVEHRQLKTIMASVK